MSQIERVLGPVKTRVKNRVQFNKKYPDLRPLLFRRSIWFIGSYH